MSGLSTRGLALGAALALSACATHRINYSNPAAAPGGAAKEYKQSFFLWGLAGGNEVNLGSECPDGVAKITSMSSAGDSILHWLTGGLYSPMSVQVQCAGAGAVGAAR